VATRVRAILDEVLEAADPRHLRLVRDDG
jgi:hypothetical protein